MDGKSSHRFLLQPKSAALLRFTLDAALVLKI
jgi:hypothetical protein